MTADPKKAQLVLFRRWFNDEATIGELFIDGQSKCFILEDKYRDLSKEPKVYGKTCIPYGIYQVVFSYSGRFKAHMPLLLNVPQFEGIRIHPGNVAADSDGCLLPGVEKKDDNTAVFYSRKAYQDLYAILKTMSEHEKIFIEIRAGALAGAA